MPSASELRRMERYNQLLRERVQLKRELRSLLRTMPSPPKPSSRVSRRPSSRGPPKSRTRFARLHPRDRRTGRFVRRSPRALQPRPAREPRAIQQQPPSAVHWKTMVRIVKQDAGGKGHVFTDADYENYTLWIVTSYSPMEHEQKFENLLKQYRIQLQREDPTIRWLSPKWRTAATYEPLGAYTTPNG